MIDRDRLRALRYFTFLGAYSSGQMELYEELSVRLVFADRRELGEILETLGVLRLTDHPVSSMTAGGDHSVLDHPDVLQPLRCTVGGVECFVYVQSGFIEISVAERGSGVTASRVEDAFAIEAIFDAHGLAARVRRVDDAINAVMLT